MRYQPHIRCNIAYTPWPSAYCPPLTSITSAILHLFCPSCYPTFSRTRTRAISFSQSCGSTPQPLNPERHNRLRRQAIKYNPIYRWLACYISLSAREPQWAIWWSNQDLHLTCEGAWNTSTGTMLTPYRQHRRIYAVTLRPKNRPALTPDLSPRYQYSR